MKKIYTILALALTFFCSAQLSQVLPYTSTNGFGTTQTDDTMIYNNEFYGSTAGTVSSVELRKFNGTTITEIKSFPGYYSGSLASTMMLGSFNKTESKLYFITTQTLYNTNYTVNESTSELWVTDGSAAGTLKLLTVTRPGNFAFNIILTDTHYGAFKTNSNYVGDKLIFSTYNTTMVTDGTVAGTKPLTANGIPIPMLSMPGPKLNGKYYFSATDGTLHSTDGTDEGTQNIVSNSVVSVYSPMSMPLNGKFMFWGNNSESGTELWESDGTAAGTKLFYETVPGPETGKIIYGNSIDMANDGKHIYFMLANGTDREVWSTDLTVANTKKIKDANNYLPQLSVLGNGIIYFQENTISPPYLSKIWKSDGTPEGTKQISDVFKSNSMALYQNSLYFQRAENKTTIGSNQVDNNIELWKSDGEPENTRMIFDIYPGGLTSPYVVANKSEPGMFFVLNDVLYFVAKNASGKFIYKFKGDYTFNGVTNNNWSNPNNWNSGVAPGIQDLVNIPAGFNLNIDTNSFGKDVNVSSPLNLSSGNLNIGGYLNLGANITLNNNNLNLKGGNSNISRSTLASGHYIVTNGTGTVNIENLDAARGTVNLPIGTATNYNPISISNSGTSDTFSARVSDGISNTTNGAVNSTWEISEATAGGSNVNLSLGWNASQENSSFSRNSAKVGHYLNGSWNEENSGSVSGTDPFTISATGITSFSPFSVMNFGALASNNISKNQVLVYPNPFNENFTISLNENSVVNFYDISGKLVSSSILLKGNNTLNKSDLQKGVYIYQVKGNSGNVIANGKIIKK